MISAFYEQGIAKETGNFLDAIKDHDLAIVILLGLAVGMWLVCRFLAREVWPWAKAKVDELAKAHSAFMEKISTEMVLIKTSQIHTEERIDTIEQNQRDRSEDRRAQTEALAAAVDRLTAMVDRQTDIVDEFRQIIELLKRNGTK